LPVPDPALFSVVDADVLPDDPRLAPDPLPMTSHSMHEPSHVPPSHGAVHVSSRHRPLSSASAPAFVHGSPTLRPSQSWGGGMASARAGSEIADVATRLENAKNARVLGLMVCPLSSLGVKGVGEGNELTYVPGCS
jgi:hypothetical protein